MKSREAELQQACVKWFRYSYPGIIIHHSPNGGKRDGWERLKFSKMGVYPGFPDIIILGPGRPLFLEMKADKGKLSDSQIVAIGCIRTAGYEAHVVRSLDQFIEIVNNYMKQKIKEL